MFVKISVFSAIMSGSLFGVSGYFNSEYITAVMSGQALGEGKKYIS